MILLVDNFDSFTYTIKDYFNQLHIDCSVVRSNCSLESLSGENFRGIVLSAGPGTPRQAGSLLNIIERYYNDLPILGICLGHQAIGEFFGAKLSKAKRPLHGKVVVAKCDEDYLFGNHRKLQVTCYHSLTLNNLPPALIPIARSDQGEILAIKHKTLPIRGVQFHPEAHLTEYGLSILHNWIIYNNIDR